jgi:glycosyltransferase involved in cell wall biosynthesis
MRRILSNGREGILYDPADAGGLADALERLTDAVERRRLGSAARARAERDFSWARHCEALDAALGAALAGRAATVA